MRTIYGPFSMVTKKHPTEEVLDDLSKGVWGRGHFRVRSKPGAREFSRNLQG